MNLPGSNEFEVSEEAVRLEQQFRLHREFFENYTEEWNRILLDQSLLNMAHSGGTDDPPLITERLLRDQVKLLLRMMDLGSKREDRLRSLFRKFSRTITQLVEAKRSSSGGNQRNASHGHNSCVCDALYAQLRKIEEAIMELLRYEL
jgi:hypothetical protein